jgi:proteic killer suppression protein
VIKNFKSKTAQDIYDGIKSKNTRKIPVEIQEKARRLFDQINASTSINTLRKPPSNRLEKLKGDLETLWSLRINNQWRIIFRWEESDALDVDIIDYH